MYGFGVDAPRDAPSHYFKEEKLYGIDITTQAWGHDYQMQARQRAGNRKGAHPTVGKLHLNLRDFKMCARRAGQLLEGVACGGLLDNLLSRPPRGRPWRMFPIAGGSSRKRRLNHRVFRITTESQGLPSYLCVIYHVAVTDCHVCSCCAPVGRLT
jgi:hypothetical protein